MFQILDCSQCGKGGLLPVTVEYDVEHNMCASCHHHSSREWRYYFCGLPCFLRWTMSIIQAGGISCKDCIHHDSETGIAVPTGFRFGFQENGVCPTCHGKKIVKVNT